MLERFRQQADFDKDIRGIEWTKQSESLTHTLYCPSACIISGGY
jgi:hypothetical protein